MTVITRFAPSPTGFLHIGGARTALFNYLYAKKQQGKFLIRIEDTDRLRSQAQFVDSIITGINWLNLEYDEPLVYQSNNYERHVSCAYELLKHNKAYKCFCSKEELEHKKQLNLQENKRYRYDHNCRYLNIADMPVDKPFAIRLKIDDHDVTAIDDLVVGNVVIDNSQLDDFIILRSDLTPTYMFAVVVDDHDMGVTHIIRGDDHLTNTFKQYHIYQALNWQLPAFAHIPLIHAMEGGKLSKRHGATDVGEYQLQGFLPEALRNYLLKLGWSHGDDEIINDQQAIEWFDIKDINKAPAKFDIDKLLSINHYYIMHADNQRLFNLVMELLPSHVDSNMLVLNYDIYLRQALDSFKKRAKTLIDIIENSKFLIINFQILMSGANVALLQDHREMISLQLGILKDLHEWDRDAIYQYLKAWCSNNRYQLKHLAHGLRVALTGADTVSISNFDIMSILGKEETIKRIEYALSL